MREKKSKKLLPQSTDVNITSLLDVLTVLIFFLIKSSSVNTNSIVPPDGIRLPSSVKEQATFEAIRLAVTKNKIFVDDKLILEFDGNDLPVHLLGDDQRTILALQDVLSQNFEKRKKLMAGIDSNNETNSAGAKILIQADQSLKFKSIKNVLHTAAVSGYTDFQFVTIPKD